MYIQGNCGLGEETVSTMCLLIAIAWLQPTAKIPSVSCSKLY